MVTAPVLVIGVGNLSRGDDALGPLLVERLEAWLGSGELRGVDVVSDIQLQPEHVLDIEGRRRVLIVDATAEGDGRWTLETVEPTRERSFTTHSVSPESLAGMARVLCASDAPAIELLAVRGESFGLGEVISPAGKRNLESAWRRLRSWCREAVREPAVS